MRVKAQSQRSIGAQGAACAAVIAAACTVGGCSAGAIDAVDLDPQTLWQGLIAHWTFDDTGTTLTDSSGNNNNGTILPGATPSAGHFGGAFHFDGSDQGEIDVPAFPQPTASWSIAGWVSAPAGDTGDSYATIISTEVLRTGGWELNLRLAPPPALQTNPQNTTSAYQYAYWIGPGDSAYRFKECPCFVAKEWIHIAGVVDTDQKLISIYHNGVLAGSSDAPETITQIQGNDSLYFGRWASDLGRRLIGDLDDFVVYNRVLTLPEIRQLARAPMPTMRP